MKTSEFLHDGFLGAYKIVKKIHEGSHAHVYQAESKAGDSVVLKVAEENAAVRERQVLLELKKKDVSCNHFVRLLDYMIHEEILPFLGRQDEDTKLGCLILEYATMSLDRWLLQKNFQPTWVEVLDVGSSLGSSLQELHSLGLIHNDVKPANFLRSSSGQWKLCDFGSTTEDGSVRFEVTSSYCPPEQAKSILNSEIVLASQDSDVWAFGKILYEMVSGQPDILVDDSRPDVMEVIAQLESDVVQDDKIRFPALRSVLRSALQLSPPRM
ncbi:hypothetical protein GUITHDRAFT_150527, partial [Guillardia theta CCMP2712]